MQYDLQLDAWRVLLLDSGIYVGDRVAIVGITCEKLFQRGMPMEDCIPHNC